MNKNKMDEALRLYKKHKLAEGGEVEEAPVEEAPIAEPVIAEQPKLQVAPIAPPPVQSGVTLTPSDMTLTKRDRVDLPELPAIQTPELATSKAQGDGGKEGGGILGKVLGFLGLGMADGGEVENKADKLSALSKMFADAAAEEAKKTGKVQTYKVGNVTHAVGRGAGSKEEEKYKDIPASLLNSQGYKDMFEGMDEQEKDTAEAFLLNQYRAGKKVRSAKEYEASPEFVGPPTPKGMADGGGVGNFAALTNAISALSGKTFPEVAMAPPKSEKETVPVTKPVAAADGLLVSESDLITDPVREYQENEKIDDETMPLEDLRRKAVDIRAAANDQYVQPQMRSAFATQADGLDALLKKRTDEALEGLNAADAAEQVGSMDAESAARKSPLLTKKAPNFSGVSADERSANASLLDRTPSLRSALDAAGVLAQAGILTPETSARIGKTLGKASEQAAAEKAGLAADVEARKVIADEKAAADKKVADDKVAADAKAKADKDASLVQASADLKAGKATPEQKKLLLDRLDELTTEARSVIQGKKTDVAANAAAPATATTGGGGDAAIPKTTDALSQATLDGIGTIATAPTPSAPAPGRIELSQALQSAISSEATRYTPETFAALSAISARPSVVYQTAKMSGFDDASARKAAVDQTISELTGPRLPVLPSGEEAMALARNSPEVAAMRAAAQRQAEIKLRDTALLTQEAQATAKLREAQTDLQLAQANEFEVRRTAQQAQLDTLRNAVVNDTVNLDKYLADAKSRQSFGFIRHALAFVGTAMGGNVNPYALAKQNIANELNTQLNVVDRKRTLLGELIKEGNSMDDAYKLADAQLKNLFALQLQKAAAPLRDERARLAGLDAANKLLYDAAKAQEEVVRKQVDAIYEPYKIKLQGQAGGIRDIFDYIKQGGDMEALRQRLASDAADRSVRRSELGVRKEEAQLKREELQIKSAGNDLVGRLLAGQPLQNSGEYASVIKANPELRKALVKPFEVDTSGKVTTLPGFVLARSDEAAKDLVELKGLSEKSLDFLDRMEGLLKANGYNYRSMSSADQGAFLTARDEFVSALGSKAARNVGVPSDAEYARLAGSVPDASWYENADRAQGKLDEFRRIFTGILKRTYDNNVYTPGQTGGTTTPASKGATFKVRSKSNPSQVVSVDRQTALDMLKGPGGADLEILP